MSKKKLKVPLHIKDVNPKDKKQIDAFFKQEIQRAKDLICPTCGGIIRHHRYRPGDIYRLLHNKKKLSPKKQRSQTTMTKLREIEGIVKDLLDQECPNCLGKGCKSCYNTGCYLSESYKKKVRPLASALLEWHESKQLLECEIAHILFLYQKTQTAETIANLIKKAMDKKR